jgi:hypothetical protein
MPRTPPFAATLAGAALLALLAPPALAHVKWFAPYIVDAAPRPISMTLGDPWFWAGIVLVSAFFTAARLVERSRYGEPILGLMDRATDPLWTRLDAFVRIMVGGFFVAIFAVGGVYLTPDLATPAPWVSWMQLAIAACVAVTTLMPVAGLGILGLWVLALQDYEFFHLLDYLALGACVAAYLIFAGSRIDRLVKRRFEVLRWGVAIALMWSSLEKFAYPEWFHPLVEERPFLTFGLPRDVFVPMAGVAEFTMGLGLLWTPLVRRLSAIALLAIFTAAIIPFGRVDLVGHGLIMAILVAIAVDPTRGLRFLPGLRAAMPAPPIGIAGSLVLFAGAYWGLHAAFFGRDAPTMAEILASPRGPTTEMLAAEYPHGTHGGGDEGFISSIGMEAAAPEGTVADAYTEAMAAMHHEMMQGLTHPDPDAAFVLGMIPHHRGGVDMARILLDTGSDPELASLAQAIIRVQEQEIRVMERWLETNEPVASGEFDGAMSELEGTDRMEGNHEGMSNLMPMDPDAMDGMDHSATGHGALPVQGVAAIEETAAD